MNGLPPDDKSNEISTKMLLNARRSAQRTRAAAACVSCKELRSKCSGFLPCARCSRSSRECIFSTSSPHSTLSPAIDPHPADSALSPRSFAQPARQVVCPSDLPDTRPSDPGPGVALFPLQADEPMSASTRRQIIVIDSFSVPDLVQNGKQSDEGNRTLNNIPVVASSVQPSDGSTRCDPNSHRYHPYRDHAKQDRPSRDSYQLFGTQEQHGEAASWAFPGRSLDGLGVDAHLLDPALANVATTIRSREGDHGAARPSAAAAGSDGWTLPPRAWIEGAGGAAASAARGGPEGAGAGGVGRAAPDPIRRPAPRTRDAGGPG